MKKIEAISLETVYTIVFNNKKINTNIEKDSNINLQN